jgi:succinate dehydrogenase / fumarate reductase membrane anchor subunit
MVNRIVVGAHYGLRDWLAQRVTAVFMVVYSIIFAIGALTLPEMSYEAWSGLFAGGFMRFVTFLFFLALFYHAWVGIRDIYMDYIKPVSIRLTLHVITLFVLIGYAGWAAQILWRL